LITAWWGELTRVVQVAPASATAEISRICGANATVERGPGKDSRIRPDPDFR
jgi:hypothetical protein